MLILTYYRVEPIGSYGNILSDNLDLLHNSSNGRLILNRVHKLLTLKAKGCSFSFEHVRVSQNSSTPRYFVTLYITTTEICQSDTIIGKTYEAQGKTFSIQFKKDLKVKFILSIDVSSPKDIIEKSKTIFSWVHWSRNAAIFRLNRKTYCAEIELTSEEIEAISDDGREELGIAAVNGDDGISNASFPVCWDNYISVMSKTSGVDKLWENIYLTLFIINWITLLIRRDIV